MNTATLSQAPAAGTDTGLGSVVPIATTVGLGFVVALLLGGLVAPAWAIAPLVVGLVRLSMQLPAFLPRVPVLEGAIVAILVVGVAVPATLFDFDAIGLSSDDLATVVAGILLLYWYWRHRRDLTVPRVAYPFFLWLAWTAVSWAVETRTTFGLLSGPVRIVFYAMLLVAGLHWFRRRELVHFALGLLVVVGLLEAAFGLWSYLVDWKILRLFIGIELFRDRQPLGQVVSGRITATLGLPSNFTGAFFLFPALVAVGYGSLATAWRERLGWWAVYGLIAWALMMTFTRGSFLSMALGLVGFFVFSAKRWMMPATALVVIAVLVFTPFLRRFEEDLQRLPIFGEAFSVIWENAATGVGPGEYLPDAPTTPIEDPDDPGSEAPPTEAAADRDETPHNSVLLVASEVGLPGAAFFLAAVLGTMALAWGGGLGIRRSDDAILATAVFAALGAFFLQSQTNNMFQIPPVAIQFWILGAAGAWLASTAGGRWSEFLFSPGLGRG